MTKPWFNFWSPRSLFSSNSTASTPTFSWFTNWSSSPEANLFHFSSANNYLTSAYLSRINTNVIKSSMYLSYYHSSRPFTCFHLPSSERLFFISSSNLINQLTEIETSPDNQYTKRIQSFKYNQSLLSSNPVSSASLNSSNYIKSQHQLFVKLAKELNINQIQLPTKPTIVHDTDLVPFIINLTAQVYLPMLLNIPSSSVPLILDDFIELLHLLEVATGKHNITFQDYLSHATVIYSDDMEQQYIRLFHHIIMKITTSPTSSSSSSNSSSSSASLDELSEEIISRLSSSNIVSVLSTTMNPQKQSRLMVNNILSWLDNMLNIVHTIVNLIILIGQQNNGLFSHEFYLRTLPSARALATMFMRHVIEPFHIIKDNGHHLQFRQGDIIMMSNGNSDTVFGGKGRKCPSKSWSYPFMSQLLELITKNYVIQYTSPHPAPLVDTSACLPTPSPLSFKRSSVTSLVVPPQDSENNSWFWNKFSTQGIQLIPKH